MIHRMKLNESPFERIKNKKGENYMDEEIKFNSLIPELSVSNIDNSKKFYENLGFKIIEETDSRYYMEYKVVDKNRK